MRNLSEISREGLPKRFENNNTEYNGESGNRTHTHSLKACLESDLKLVQLITEHRRNRHLQFLLKIL